MPDPQNFFTPDAVVQFGSAVTMVTVAAVALRKATGINSPAIPAAISLLIAYMGAGLTDGLAAIPLTGFPTHTFFRPLISWIVLLFNACLLFVSAIGATDALGVATQKSRGKKVGISVSRKSTKLAIQHPDESHIEYKSKGIPPGTVTGPVRHRDKAPSDDIQALSSEVMEHREHAEYLARPSVPLFQSWFDR